MNYKKYISRKRDLSSSSYPNIANYLGGDFYEKDYMPYVKSCAKHYLKKDFNQSIASERFVRKFAHKLENKINQWGVDEEELFGSLDFSIIHLLDDIKEEAKEMKKMKFK